MAVYKHGRGFELGTTENKSSKWPEWDSNPLAPDCESNALTTLPFCKYTFSRLSSIQFLKELVERICL